MKTPEELKKGLENCAKLRVCTKCPSDRRDFPLCIQRKSEDALARIEQLEYALCLMINQYCQEGDSVTHKHMMAGEHAFAALGIADYTSIETVDKMLDEMEGATCKRPRNANAASIIRAGSQGQAWNTALFDF